MQSDELSNSNYDDDICLVESNEVLDVLCMEDSQDDESSFEDDLDWGFLEDSVVIEEIDGDDDEFFSSIDDKDDFRNMLRCV